MSKCVGVVSWVFALILREHKPMTTRQLELLSCEGLRRDLMITFLYCIKHSKDKRVCGSVTRLRFFCHELCLSGLVYCGFLQVTVHRDLTAYLFEYFVILMFLIRFCCFERKVGWFVFIGICNTTAPPADSSVNLKCVCILKLVFPLTYL